MKKKILFVQIMLLISAALSSACFTTSCILFGEEQVKVTGVSLDKTEMTLVEGDSETLIATVVPEDATNKNVTWKSSNTDIATINSSGRVTAVSAGETKVTVKTEDGGKTATCKVTVTADTIAVTDVSLDKTEITLVEGDSETLVATVIPEDATNKNVTWKSDNTSVATVSSSGRVTAVSAGETKVTVKTEDGGKTATCTVTVIPSGGGGGVEGALSFTVNGVSFNMIPIEGGTFWMGAQRETPDGQNYDPDAYRDERPVHQVMLSDYYMGETEVTQALWQAVMGRNPSDFTGDLQRPVESVSWNKIVNDFLPALNAATGRTFALPTEAQWEFAARGGNQSHGYKYAGSDNIEDVAWYDDNSDAETHPVKGKSPNELGLYDMSGNVYEWCNDWFDDFYYRDSPSSNPTGPESGDLRVLRGGRWSYDAGQCRVSYRHYPGSPYDSYSSYGFRLATVDNTGKVTGVSLDKTVLTLQEGESATLTATVTPENATNKNVTWVSDNTSVATVDNTGKITAVGEGRATITVTTEDGGKTATCSVIINNLNNLTFTVNGVSFNMIPVPGGTFYMGAQKTDPSGQNYDADAHNNESPVHQVTLSDYYMGETEVTQALWQAVMRQCPTSDGDQWNGLYGIGDNYPAYYISWNDIQGFLTALNAATASQRGNKTFAMPTEAQWEFAARGGNQSHGYKYAGSDNIEDVAWYDENAWNEGYHDPDFGTHVMKMKSPNELGLYDMSGNVFEWCNDWYDEYYSSLPSSNPTGPESGTWRMLHGGSCYNLAGYCRVSCRCTDYPDRRGGFGGYYGFRLVLLP